MKTLVLGATPNPARYAYAAVKRLLKHNHEVVPVGIKNGEVEGLNILKQDDPVEDIDTVTLYVGPRNQPSWYDYIIALKPRRIIFNPGTHNPELKELAAKNNIETIDHCTLVMLNTGSY